MTERGRARRGRAPRAYHHGDLPAALVAAAVEQVARQGPEALTLREVARSVGVSHTAAYRHFEDRAALLTAVAEEGFTTLAAQMTEALAASDPGARPALLALGQAYLAFALARPGHFRVMFGPPLAAGPGSTSLEAAVQRVLAPLVGALERGLAAGQLRGGSARDIGVSFWALTHGYAVLVAHQRVRTRSATAAADHYARQLLPLLLDGLAAPARD